MKWFLNLTTRGKLFAGFGLIIILLAAVIATAYNSLTAIENTQRELYEEDIANAIATYNIRVNMNGARAALLDMVLISTRSEQEAWHEDIKERTKAINADIQKLVDHTANDPHTGVESKELQKLLAEFAELRDTTIIPLIYANKRDEAMKLILGMQVARFKEIRDLAIELSNDADKHVQAQMAESERRAEMSKQAFSVLGVAAILLGMAMAFLLNRIIAVPLRTLSGMVEQVAAGDLTVTGLPEKRKDEVGDLARAFRAMLDSLRLTTRETLESVNVLASSSSQILATTSQIAASSAETATAVSETTVTVEEVKQTAQLSSQKARNVSDTAQKAALAYQGGRKSVEGVIQGMHGIQEQMEAIVESIMRLSEQSQTIGEIIATVNNLAEQSNVLAVNAAIEAAKAGELGKGFGVVAQEVKSLADQSKQATAQVRTILGEIQKATSAAVLATEQGNKSVEAGMKQAGATEESIRLLADSINEAAQAATQIAASSQQQMVGMDQVALAMENIKQASSQNATGTKQSENAAQQLHAMGQNLKQLMARYKL